MSTAFDTNKAYLRQSTSDKPSLYDHLSDVLAELIKTKPSNPYEIFEHLSVRIKNGAAAVAPVTTDVKPSEPNNIPTTQAEREKLSAYIKQTETLLAPPRLEEDEDAPELITQMPDLTVHAELFAQAGVALSEEETYKLTLSIQRLSEKEEFETVRFFGKIYGTQKNYYIVEAKLGEYPEEEDEDARNEPLGTGANEYIYYASNSTAGGWKRLPSVTAEQIRIARQVRRFFTGNLEAVVYGMPRWRWGEAALLRTQVRETKPVAFACSSMIQPMLY